MGIVKVKHGKRNYTVQLEEHYRGKNELPVEKLHAVFLEAHDVPKDPEDVAEILQFHLYGKTKALAEKAKRAGGEIWLGDLTPTEAEDRNRDLAFTAGTLVAGGAAIFAALSSRRRFLKTLGVLGAGAALHPFTHFKILDSPGNANDRKISRALTSAYGKPFSIIDLRNRVMAHQIKTLAEKSGHTQIGVNIGAAHADITNMLENGRELTEEEKKEVRQREAEAGCMFRCRYNKTEGRWKVEKHQL